MSVRTFGLALNLTLVSAASSAAPMRRPFEVGGGEGGGSYDGLTGWLLAAQSRLTHEMAFDLRASVQDIWALWALVAVGFLYGVVHAAGPGHGKAVIASYMMANESALRRGVVLAFFAAALQGLAAIGIVAIAALAFNATAAKMNAVADGLATASYLGVAAIGAWLAWKKGGAFVRAMRAFLARREALAGALLFAHAPWRPASAMVGVSAFHSGELLDDGCGRLHGPDPRVLGANFSWRAALTTVAAAGARPCSGALLILVFALAQGLFWIGVAAVAAMSLGTAITTGFLASLAVFAKGLAVRFAGGEDSRVALVARFCEFLASLAVLTFGLLLFFAARGVG